jgi:hypothetical protein
VIAPALTTEAALKALQEAVRKDQANRYSLVKPWTLPKIDVVVPDYESALFSIKDSAITVKPYGGDTCNGATLSPDKFLGVNIVQAALFHDPWYAEVSKIAQAWGWTEAAVRKLGDEVFADIIVATNPGKSERLVRGVARSYLTGVRLGGGVVRLYAKITGKTLLILVLASSAAGCAGCADIPDHFGGQNVPQPQYQETTDAGPGK